MIEVGEYIRTKEGYITKICECLGKDVGYKNMQHYDVDNLIPYRGFIIYKEDIKAHSKNIIDLIEIGDIVNGCRVMSVLYLKGKKETRVANFKLIDGQTYTGEIDYEGKKREFYLVVETILTHELYEQNCYKVVI